MKNKKKIMIITIFILIIAIGMLLFIKNRYEKTLPDEVEDTSKTIVNNTLEPVSIKNNYYTVKKIVEKYYSSLCNLNKTTEDILILEYDEEVENLEENLAEEKETNKQKIFNYFTEDYVKETGLTTDNLQEKLGNYSDLYVLIENMYVRDITEVLRAYFVFGTVTEKQTLEKEKFALMIATDGNNGTFNIYTADYIKNHNLYELSKKENFNKETFTITQIENRKYNKYKFDLINDETYVKDLLKSYTQSIKYGNTDFTYSKLDEEYKKQRFSTEKAYQEYIDKNKKNITSATIKYYKKEKQDGYTQYILIDNKGNYYIFNETSIMNYNLILDTYTIDLLEFIEKYEAASTEEKVMLNIQKIVEALNNEDYKYVYSKLVNEFKTNNFKTYEDFEKYAKETFDIGNEVTFNMYTESENYSTYKITLKGQNKTITKTIVMKLEEGTNFIMSFEV